MDIESELEEAKNILAQIQALHMEVIEKARNNREPCKVTPVEKKPHKTHLKPFKTKPTVVQRSDDNPKPIQKSNSAITRMRRTPNLERYIHPFYPFLCGNIYSWIYIGQGESKVT